MRRCWPWLRALIAVGILVLLGWRLGTDAFLDGLRVINAWSVLAALGIGLLTTVCCAWRWCLVARRLGLPLTLRTAVPDYYRSLLLNSVLPAGVLGDVHRAVSHGRQSGDLGRGVRAVVLERFAGQVVLLALGAILLLGQPAIAGEFGPSREVVIAVLCGLIAVVALLGWARYGHSDSARRRALGTILTDARLGLLSSDAWPGVLSLSAVTVLGHLAMFLVAARLAGSAAPIGQLVPLMMLALVVMALPVNVGGWGPREAFLALAFGAAGLGAAQGLTIAVVYGVLALIASLPGAVVLLLPRPRPPEQKDMHRTNRQGWQADPSLFAPKPATAGQPLPIRNTVSVRP